MFNAEPWNLEALWWPQGPLACRDASRAHNDKASPGPLSMTNHDSSCQQRQLHSGEPERAYKRGTSHVLTSGRRHHFVMGLDGKGSQVRWDRSSAESSGPCPPGFLSSAAPESLTPRPCLSPPSVSRLRLVMSQESCSRGLRCAQGGRKSGGYF